VKDVQVPVSPEINELLDDATQLSVRRSQFFVGVDHLFESILVKVDLLPRAFRKQYQEALRAASHEMSREYWRGRTPTYGSEVFYTPRCAGVTSEAARLAQRISKTSPSAGHLLLAILADSHAMPSRAMDRLGLNRGDMIKDLRLELSKGTKARRNFPKPSKTAATKKPEQVRAGPQVIESPQFEAEEAGSTPAENLTRDLTELSRRGDLEPAIGRDRDILTLVEILSRKTKNNVILVGEAGVGKTHVVEGLAWAAINRKAGGHLREFRILELNMAALMAGTQYRGAFEEKLMGLLEQLRGAKNTVLFIDEIHLVMGAGSTEGGSIDMANLLKPALARGELRCIGATTIQEYRKFVERDPALERRFQMLRIEELSPSACWEILAHLKPGLEKHHSVHISRKALHAAISLTQRYMPNRQLPDKAIDAIDQACARYRLKTFSSQGKGFTLDSDTPPGDRVTPHDVRKVVSRMTGIPIEEITAEERIRLGDLERRIKKRIIGQDDAVSRAVAAVKRARAGLGDPNRPEAVMLFLGPTGVGKTQLAKILANYLFGSKEHLVKFDMAEYIEEHSVSRLLGAPPGYKGSDEEGRLAQAIRSHPFSILLFDEIEKAHSRVFDIFLPILDEGRMKDSHGREISFRNSIIIFTSNIGASCLHRTGHPANDDKLMDELRRRFRPEFINRIDEIVPFYPLVFEDIRTMLHLCLKEANERLRDRKIQLHVYQGAYEYLAKEGYHPEFGARELRRAVDRLVMNPLSAMLLEGQFQSGDTVDVLQEDGGLVFRRGEAPLEQEALSS
jgi:ATP-dependent Clp protease ATP-binding subunit ClpC